MNHDKLLIPVGFDKSGKTSAPIFPLFARDWAKTWHKVLKTTVRLRAVNIINYFKTGRITVTFETDLI